MIANIKRPDFYDGDKVVTLYAEVKSGEITKTKDFKFLIRKADRTDEQSLAEDVKYIKDSIPTIVKSDIEVMSMSSMPCGSTVTWTSSVENYLSNTGDVTRPDFGLPSEEAEITAIVKKGEETETIKITVTILSMTEEDELNVIAKKITWDLIKKENIDKTRITTDLDLVTTLDSIENVTISWQSSDTAYVSNVGKVTRPEYTDSDAQITLTATLSKNNNNKQITLTGLKVIKKSPSAQQRCEEYVNNEANLIKWVTANGTNGNQNLTNIIEGFILPAENDDMLLTWSVVNSTGEVTTNSYFKIEYVDGDGESQGKEATAEQSRRYVATVTRPSGNNVQTYLKVVSTISETEIDGVSVPGGTASKINPIIIIQNENSLSFKMAAYEYNIELESKKYEFENMLKSETGRATWSIQHHKDLQEDIRKESNFPKEDY